MIVSVPIRGLFNLTAGYDVATMRLSPDGVFPSPLGDYLI